MERPISVDSWLARYTIASRIASRTQSCEMMMRRATSARKSELPRARRRRYVERCFDRRKTTRFNFIE
jgi:hypothetical protein